MGKTFILQPQRSNGIHWTDCPDHQATRWAVIQQEEYFRAGKRARSRRVLSRHLTKAPAEAEIASRRKGAEGPLRRYVLGARMQRSGAST